MILFLVFCFFYDLENDNGFLLKFGSYGIVYRFLENFLIFKRVKLNSLEVFSFLMDVDGLFGLDKSKKFMFVNVRKNLINVRFDLFCIFENLDVDIFVVESVMLFGKFDYLESLGDFMVDLVEVEKNGDELFELVVLKFIIYE